MSEIAIRNNKVKCITSERFSKASPTVKFRSSYTPPLISDMTSTASKTLTTPPGLLLVSRLGNGSKNVPSLSRIGTLDMLYLTSK